MKRIISTLTLALIMAMMLVAIAAPAFANHTAGHTLAQDTKRCIGFAVEQQFQPGARECVGRDPS
jgi:hypothetical protein